MALPVSSSHDVQWFEVELPSFVTNDEAARQIAASLVDSPSEPGLAFLAAEVRDARASLRCVKQLPAAANWPELRGFLAYRGAVLLTTPPLTIDYPPSQDNTTIPGDLLTLRLSLSVAQCAHVAFMEQCRDFFLKHAIICVSLDAGVPSCGAAEDIVPGGLSFHGLSSGLHDIDVSMEVRPVLKEEAESLAPGQCNASFSFWEVSSLKKRVFMEPLTLPRHVEASMAPPREPVGTHHECGSFVDDSEWCMYRPACIDLHTLGVVFLGDLDDGPRLGRRDDLSFVPRSLDRSPEMLPHRSAGLSQTFQHGIPGGAENHLNHSAFSRAHSNGAVAWVPGVAGAMFVDSPQNIYHTATKAFQLNYALEALGINAEIGLAAIFPLSCVGTSGSRTLDANGGHCVPALGLATEASAAWMNGILNILFKSTAVYHDPISMATKWAQSGGVPPEFICFDGLVVPGEARSLFRGPSDARRFRLKARRYLGLSPVLLQPPPSMVIVQRAGGRRIANLDKLLPRLQKIVNSTGDWNSAFPTTFPRSKFHLPIKVRVAHLEDMTSFSEQAILFAGAGVAVAVHGAAVANFVFMPPGAAVIELKQFGEFGTQPRDLCSAGQLHHAAIRSARPPAAAEVSAQSWCPPVRPLGCHAGAPMSFCDSMSYHPGSYDVQVDSARLELAVSEALAVTGLRTIVCEGRAKGGVCGPTALGWGTGG